MDSLLVIVTGAWNVASLFRRTYTRCETVPAQTPDSWNVSFEARGERRRCSSQAGHGAIQGWSVHLAQLKTQNTSSEFPVSAFGLSLRLFYSPPINITLMIWGYGSRNTIKHFDILKADLRNHEGYLLMFSAALDSSWSYFLTEGTGSAYPGRWKYSLLSYSSEQMMLLTAALSACFLFFTAITEDHS